ncbi:flagellar export protein FliJ [Helicobacter marmotae]|uniref:Uncharacterized protein n=1 Tax=Helicobacter marmotae TaxID=152490 RepID=A0A3D8I478_9HELI|nr:flagellar export protein FliJ [Helicobacter marmotae]RDU59331.1 hypothetical protein CQA63_07300 [Helicobacter marmotae]
MTTKFSPIIDLRKKDMQECERAILQNENNITNKRAQIERIADELVGLKMPQNGMFSAMQAYNEMKKMLLAHLQNIQDELNELLLHKNSLQNQYKKHHIEYEKIAFLDKKEQDKMFKALNNREKREVDEIAMMLYNRTGGKRI